MNLRYTTKDIDLLGRLIRAEAVGDGNLGMMMVGNVVTNRAIVTCLDFTKLNNINDVIYAPNAFASINSPLFVARANAKEKELAEKCLKGEKTYPATNALWFYAPPSGEKCREAWFNQMNIGRYKSHCFYRPDPGVCKELK